MKQYRFEGFPDHPVLRKFVYDFESSYRSLPAAKAVVKTAIVEQIRGGLMADSW